MTAEKLLDVAKFYLSHLKSMGLSGKEFDESAYESLKTGMHLLDHCIWMLSMIEGFVAQETPEDLEKAFQWLGFVQGCLAALQCFTIKELREHGRS